MFLGPRRAWKEAPGHWASRESAEMSESRKVGLRSASLEQEPWRHKPGGPSLSGNCDEFLEAESGAVRGRETLRGLRAPATWRILPPEKSGLEHMC